MAKKNTLYTEEFKKQVVDLYNSKTKTVSELNSEYGVSNVTIYQWIKQLTPVKINETEEMSSKDYDKMKKRIAELEMENEILKKATAIFARKQ